ncbi:MAG: hypothetical protein ACOX4A_08455 [Saccharofermentanales bacterium]
MPILAFIVSFLVLAGGCTLIGEGKFLLQDVAGVLKLLAVHFYAHMSCVAVVLFIATATRSLAATLILPLLYTTLFHKFICGALTTVSGQGLHPACQFPCRQLYHPRQH